ncbi:MAG: endonuclease/exonuclease/phosphatase family protein [Candidatus Desulfofervidaceae bacterium]|nr:endonuclease/exonuclease/phosphatase family protein [Candidatus Desulfofervidaceae bacterium]MDL1970770.1 endonuclease/exonuclease/phosphatase family protein [Candidatus Desulfofervidaceae bacterium]
MPILKTMTINLRYDNPADGSNQWSLRKQAVAALITELTPDIFGTQEGWEDQIKELQELLPAYRYYVTPPEWNRKRMFPCVWVRKEMEVKEHRTFWLSPTPSIPFSKAWNSAFPRSATYVIGQRNKSSFIFISTHLDNISAEARLHQAAVLCQQVEQINTASYPVILVGDFNTSPQSNVHKLLTSKSNLANIKGNFIDVWEYLKKTEESTFHSFTGQGMRGRIDWILVSPNVKIKQAIIIKQTFMGRYPSDHFPVMAELEI